MFREDTSGQCNSLIVLMDSLQRELPLTDNTGVALDLTHWHSRRPFWRPLGTLSCDRSWPIAACGHQLRWAVKVPISWRWAIGSPSAFRDLPGDPRKLSFRL